MKRVLQILVLACVCAPAVASTTIEGESDQILSLENLYGVDAKRPSYGSGRMSMGSYNRGFYGSILLFGYTNLSVGEASVHYLNMCALRSENVEISWLGAEFFDTERVKDYYINRDDDLYNSLLNEVDGELGPANIVGSYRMDVRYLLPFNEYATFTAMVGASCSKYIGYGIVGASLRIRLINMINIEPTIEYRGLLNSDSYATGIGYGIGLSFGF
ncbi:MAG: hypothetical protein SNI45_04715 [Rikenellaceae bacterium]